MLALSLLTRRSKSENFRWLDQTDLRKQMICDRNYLVNVRDLRTGTGGLSDAKQDRFLRVRLSAWAKALNGFGLGSHMPSCVSGPA